jgi:HAD superfamily hydrolase (TIGR01509 family)
MNVIIPIGGKGERFSKEGYSTPKPLIEIFDKTMIECVLRNIKINVNANHANHASDILFIIYKDELDNYGFSELIAEKYPHVKLIKLTKPTKGAVETLLFGLNHIFNNNYQYNEKSLILDCDTFYGEDIIDLFKNATDNTVFYSKISSETPPIYSYIEMDNGDSKITRIAEKQKISDNANTGAYGFMNINQLMEYCTFVIENNIQFNNEPYTSCVIHEMIKAGIPFNGQQLNSSCVFSLGTPSDVKKHIQNSYSFLFDLDGTLVLTDDIYFKIWSNILFDFNITLTKKLFVKYIQGNTDIYVINSFNILIDLKTLSARKDDEFIKNIDAIKIIPGSTELLQLVKKNGHNCCIVTNCNKRVATKIIEVCSFHEYIDFFISCDDCKFGKPNPEPYLNAINKYKTTNKKCLIFEDSKSGLLSARQVNPKLIIGIETLFGKDELNNSGANITLADYVICNDINYFLRNINDKTIEMKEMIKNSSTFNIKSIDIADTTMKGGFIADVFKVKIETHDGDLHNCVFKYENKNINNLSIMANKLQLYEREYYFYKKISPQINVKIPKFIDIVKNRDDKSCGVLLEDLFMNPNLKINLDLNVESIDISLKIIKRIAIMHSKFWNKQLEKIYPKMKKNDAVIFSPFLKDFIAEKISLFKEKWSVVLSPKQIFLCDEIAKKFDDVQKKMSTGHLTIVHGDIKSPNIFYDTVNDEPYFLDWQHCCIGKGTQDLVFFLLESFDTKNLKLLFPLFKNYYYKILLENGISDYPIQEYENDIKDSIKYLPFFTSIWFGTVPNEELIDKNWPFFFIQKTFFLLEEA